MNVLVTGGAGYIGSHTAKALTKRGYDPVVFDDNLSMGHRSECAVGPADQGGSFRDRSASREHKIDAVVHFAGRAFVGESMQAPRLYFHNNVVNTFRLLDAMLDHGVRLFVFSPLAQPMAIPSASPSRKIIGTSCESLLRV